MSLVKNFEICTIEEYQQLKKALFLLYFYYYINNISIILFIFTLYFSIHVKSIQQQEYRNVNDSSFDFSQSQVGKLVINVSVCVGQAPFRHLHSSQITVILEWSIKESPIINCTQVIQLLAVVTKLFARRRRLFVLAVREDEISIEGLRRSEDRRFDRHDGRGSPI